MKSYTSNTVKGFGILSNFFSQFLALKRITNSVDDQVAEMLRDFKDVERMIERDLSSCNVVEIGHGQMPLQTAYFSCRSASAIGVDMDKVPVGLNPISYFDVWRNNGFKRTLKSLGRELLGFNSRFRRSFAKQMNLDAFPKLDLRVGDVTKGLELPEDSCDVVFSTDVFEHLSDPLKAIEEIKRILKPGGVVVTRTLHWGHANASHDIRVIVGEKVGRWGHLRPSIRDEVQTGAYVNQFRIKDWIELFEAEFRQVAHNVIPHHSERMNVLKNELVAAREIGELEEFDDNELLASHLVLRCEC